LYVKD